MELKPRADCILQRRERQRWEFAAFPFTICSIPRLLIPRLAPAGSRRTTPDVTDGVTTSRLNQGLGTGGAGVCGDGAGAGLNRCCRRSSRLRRASSRRSTAEDDGGGGPFSSSRNADSGMICCSSGGIRDFSRIGASFRTGEGLASAALGGSGCGFSAAAGTT